MVHPYVLSIFLALGVPTTLAQQPTLPQLLAHLGEEATTLARSLPSFTCTEAVRSQQVKLDRHHQVIQVLRSVDFTATLRATRSNYGTLDESFDFLTVNGHPLTGGFVLPAYVQGGFSRALRYFAPEDQACYVYSLTATPNGLRIDFAAASHLPSRNACTSAGTTGFALLNPGGEITHLERTVTPRFSRQFREAAFAAIDFTPLTLNGTTYSITHHLLAELANAHDAGRFDAEYSNCKLFAATVTLGPATFPDESHPSPR